MGFCTAVTCMDGRIQEPVLRFLKERFGVEYVDLITEPGPNRILEEGVDSRTIESIRARLAISLERHGSVGIAVVGHHDCAGNPVGRDGQARHTAAAAAYLRTLAGSVPVIELWVDEDWRVHDIS